MYIVSKIKNKVARNKILNRAFNFLGNVTRCAFFVLVVKKVKILLVKNQELVKKNLISKMKESNQRLPDKSVHPARSINATSFYCFIPFVISF